MGTCKKCGIKIMDITEECPLCHCVLDDISEHNDADSNVSESGCMYPNIAASVRKVRFVERLVLFLFFW